MVDVHLELHLEEMFPLLSRSSLPSLWLILDKPTFSVEKSSAACFQVCSFDRLLPFIGSQSVSVSSYMACFLEKRRLTLINSAG